jgi:hypothetical protein
LLLLFAGSPGPRQRSFEPGTRPIRPVMREPLAEEPASGPGFLLPFGHRHSLLGPSCARWGITPPSRSAYRHKRLPDPVGVVTFRMHEIRPGWVPSVPRGRWCAPGRPNSPGRHPPPSSSRPLFSRLPHPTGGSANDEASSRIHLRSPVRPSPACDPQAERGPLGPSPGFAPRGYPRRTPGRGRSLRTGPGATSSTSIDPPSTNSTHHMRPRVALSGSATTRGLACGS